jgi:hypothetical protein
MDSKECEFRLYPASRPDKPRDLVKGFHVTPAHFYQPIPNTQSLPETLWNRPSELVGIEMNDTVQLDLLRNQFPKVRGEYDRFQPSQPANRAVSILTTGSSTALTPWSPSQLVILA